MIRLANLEAINGLSNIKPDVIAIGPGLGNSALALRSLEKVFDIPRIPLIIDADALNLIASSKELLKALQNRNQQFPGLTVITPHPGEAARLLKISGADIQSNRLACIEKLVELTRSIVVLKGQHTLIASPEHPAMQCEEGNPGMGTGGMGDILTGSIAAIAAQGVGHQLNLWESSGIAVQLHALAADNLVSKGVGPIGLTPSETILEMRSLLNKLL
jgi:hydroxyethylthiazole kinase-like uncharacterized protein yjeF